MKEILAGLLVVVAFIWFAILLLAEIHAQARGWTMEEVILNWAAPRLRKRLTRVTPPEQPALHHPVLVEDDCACQTEAHLRAHFKPDWIEMVLRQIERENKARWN